MKKEYVGISAVALFILGYVLDFLAGPVIIPVANPFLFFQPPYLGMYPFTAVSIILKTIFTFLAVNLILSFIKRKYFIKAAVVLFIAALFELYSIQQLAIGQRLIPVEWILSFAYSGIALLLCVIVYILMGIVSLFTKEKPVSGYAPPSTHDETPRFS